MGGLGVAAQLAVRLDGRVGGFAICQVFVRLIVAMGAELTLESPSKANKLCCHLRE